MSDKGWKSIQGARKDHYFIDGRALCGKHATRTGGFWVNSRNRCKTCDKKLADLRAKRMQTQE
jgi:hypothetical protein